MFAQLDEQVLRCGETADHEYGLNADLMDIFGGIYEIRTLMGT